MRDDGRVITVRSETVREAEQAADSPLLTSLVEENPGRHCRMISQQLPCERNGDACNVCRREAATQVLQQWKRQKNIPRESCLEHQETPRTGHA
jgi:cobalamin-dependent methionine synthase I